MSRTQTDQVQCYEEAARWIYERIDYERIPPVRVSPHFQLDRVRRQLQLIGSPQQRIPAVHIAGTKGKGSTAAMVDSMLRASGLRTGLFTSPHIELFEERMRVDGRQPTPDELTSLVSELQSRLETADADLIRDPPTYFEVATLLAWLYFDRQQAEVVVLETGLGGRLDCTNVCSPLVSVITSISLDHMAILGDTVEQIAAEKAGIIKRDVPVILGVRQPSVVELCESTAAEHAAPVCRLDASLEVHVSSHDRRGQQITVRTPETVHKDLWLPLVGRHQADNAALAVAAAEAVSRHDSRVTAESIRRGLQQTSWPLRFEVIAGSPTIILDAAHNPDAVSAVLSALNSGEWPEQPRALIFGACRDKDLSGMLRLLLPQFDHVTFIRSSRSPRGCTPDELHAAATGIPHSAVIRQADTMEDAVETGRSLVGSEGLICVTGSLFLTAECLGWLQNHVELPSDQQAAGRALRRPF